MHVMFVSIQVLCVSWISRTINFKSCWDRWPSHSIDWCQSTLVQFSSVQFSLVQLSWVQFSSVQLSPVQFSSVQFSSVQLSPLQFSSVQFSSVESTSAQLSPAQLSPVQLSWVQFSSVELSPVQFSPVESSWVQFSSVEFSSVQFSSVESMWFLCGGVVHIKRRRLMCRSAIWWESAGESYSSLFLICLQSICFFFPLHFFHSFLNFYFVSFARAVDTSLITFFLHFNSIFSFCL